MEKKNRKKDWKKQWGKRLMAMMAVITAAFFTACGQAKETQTSSNLRSGYIYQPSYQSISMTMEYVSNTCMNDGKLYLFGNKWVENKKNKEDGGSTHYYLASMEEDGSDLQETELKGLKERESVVKFMPDNQNRLRILTQEYHYNEKTGTEKETYRVHMLDKKGKIKDSMELKRDKKEKEESYFYLDSRSIVFFNNRIYTAVENKIYVFDQKGKQEKVYEQEEMEYINAMFLSSEQKFYIYGWEAKGEDGKYIIREWNPETGALGERMDFGDYTLYGMSICAGEGNKIFINDGNNIYLYDLSNKEITLELNWLNSDLDGNNICDYFPLEEGKILAVSTVYDDTKKENIIELAILNKKKASEVKEKKLLIYASASMEYSTTGKILSFNKTNEDYRIEVRDYSSYENPAKQLNLDITSGKIPDIIDVRGISKEQFIKKGMFTDLYQFMETDKEVKKEEFIPSVLSTLEEGGSLYFLPSSFGLRAFISGKKTVGDIEGWTVQEMAEKYHSLPEGRIFRTYATRDWIMDLVVTNSLDEYIDWETGEVKFDTDNFVDLIEFSKEFPDEDDINYDEEPDFVEIRKKGLLFLDSFYLDEIAEMQVYTNSYQKKEGYAVVSYPSADKNNKLNIEIYGDMLAITKQCKEKEGAWEFIRQFLTYEYQKSNGYAFPTRKDALEKKFKAAQAEEAYTDEDGTKVEPITEWGYERPASEEEISVIRSLIDRIGYYTSYNTVSQDIYRIIDEELQSYYAGDKTAKEAAEIIQSRVKIYVSENS